MDGSQGGKRTTARTGCGSKAPRSSQKNRQQERAFPTYFTFKDEAQRIALLADLNGDAVCGIYRQHAEAQHLVRRATARSRQHGFPLGFSIRHFPFWEQAAVWLFMMVMKVVPEYRISPARELPPRSHGQVVCHGEFGGAALGEANRCGPSFWLFHTNFAPTPATLRGRRTGGAGSVPRLSPRTCGRARAGSWSKPLDLRLARKRRFVDAKEFDVPLHALWPFS
jgi:hypothetical protein